MPGLSCSCSKQDRSLCPISIIDVSKYSFFAVPAHITAKIYPPCACLGQSSVPKALISCLFVSVTAMFRLLTGSSLSCSVPDTNTLSTQSLGPTVRPPVSITDFYLLFLMSLSVLLFRTCSIYSPWKKQGNDLSEENHVCSNLGGKQKTDSSQPVP